jgi:superfamily II RNA helicase
MKHLQKQTIDKQDFNIFLRDLSIDLNTNLKHMIEDSIIKNNITNKENKNKKNYHKGKKHIKKKDIIIQKQNEIRDKQNYEDDKLKIEYMFKKLDTKNPFIDFNNLKTKQGKIDFKVGLLDNFWKNKKNSIHHIFGIYFSLKQENITNDITDKVKALLDDYDYKLFMMKEMGEILPPLDLWNRTEKKLEDWQIETINYVNQGKSVIVKAPTSSGKSFIAMSAGIFHKKILYVCPAKPVVYQVGAHFNQMGYKVHFLVDNQSNYSYDSKTNIFIGTPMEIENNLMNIGINFDYAVFDEIHNLNKKEDGDIYENILKIINCNFLALSATIKNIDNLKNYLSKINNNQEIHYIEYNKRFINHHRWYWSNNKYNKIHPFEAYDNINDLKVENSLSFTPNDCAILWESMEEIFDEVYENIDEYSPDEYFKEEKILTLDDCREYEIFLKNKCIELSEKYPKEVQQIFTNFRSNKSESKNDDIIDFIKESKKKNMFPMIMFHTNEFECKNIFNDIYSKLDKQELDEYPYHYEILEKKQELYEEYIINRENYKSNIKVSHSTNPEYFIKDKMESYDKKEKDKFTQTVSGIYQNKLNEIKKSDIDKSKKQKREKNILKEMNNFVSNPDFCYQDIFQKHKDFIFTKSNKPMDANTIRAVRKEIKKTLGIKIDYENPLFQMLKRGIGIYIENMPEEYNWILQKLLSKKEIGIVISDKTLCLGIDLPVRTSCFLGINNNNITRDEYLQMSGRAGRRGKDTQGNIVFFGDIDYLSLIKGELPEIRGSTNSISNLYKSYDTNIEVFDNMINKERCIQGTIEIDFVNDKNKKLVWALRRYPKLIDFIKGIKSIEKKIYKTNDYNREKYIIDSLRVICESSTTIFDSYKFKKINDYKEVNDCKEFLEILMFIHNNLNYKQYMITMNIIREIFDNFNRMIYNFIL